MKGLIGMVAVALVSLLLAWGLYWNLSIGSATEFKLLAAEREILDAIDKLEQIKIGLPYALQYSFDRAFYDVGMRGGYNSIPDDVPTKDGLPYWVKDGNYFIPDWYSEVGKATKGYLNEYAEAASGEGIYTDVSVDKIYVNASSDKPMTLKGKTYEISINPNVSIVPVPYRFKIYDVAKDYVNSYCGQPFYCDTSEPDRICAWYYADREEVMMIDERYNITVWNVAKMSYDSVYPILKFKVEC